MDYVIAILICLTVLALLCPSAYTIAWSKTEHAEDLNILYAGLGIAGLTVMGGLVDNKFILWSGLFLALGLFGYVVFIYRKEESKE